MKIAKKRKETKNALLEASAFPVILTDHAIARMQQRGIPESWIFLLLEYGKEVYQNGKHTYSFHLDKAGVKQMKRKFGDVPELSKLRRLYLILTEDSVVITCAYR